MANPGDQVIIKTKKGNEKGILMPSPKKDVIIVKLENGYNIGFSKKEVKVTIVKKGVVPKTKTSKIQKRLLKSLNCALI